ncbi:bifunctional diaminohydroxyphosphoribosylaminopyrimidine deaminase/5-amino-6-(5-phosphoribosylamino)uracil reductase RibD [Burkholderia ubonensis]|uniref:bifunctional diaminohydroxyphosphoribosylaminopyrimidine deaminase/5-amino-6-(5-phosphoribosylamino)uracil reductase RibD n=1 Tax=Burkholderia ubonensis TaxID=101571 RepID=UPI0007555ECF|nr:bifunctional diaminohydroxyphosphoribosylaminopyrimidine deaminase/5-amino-6-(5-phosphoribosylamino)uracil reductase RibD [Burkholderia ubonensis]KVN26744.1 diaminohydroxyphosphoribosylaminopyrimidine deaminase [Burkholderia ubonensis]
MFTESDITHMRYALALSERGIYTATPGPRVGCVIVKRDTAIGEGFMQQAGQEPVEMRALMYAQGQGHDLRGSTVYITLEPTACREHTPAVQALIDARVRKVVVAMEHPDPQIAGQSLVALRNSGIDVQCGLLAKESYETNIGFVSRMTRGRPWVRMKTAASLDGRTALASGESQWITGSSARNDGHKWRARACAILTGIGTVLKDDPQLNVRAIDTPRQPNRILIDTHLAIPLTARLLEGGSLCIFSGTLDAAGELRANELRSRGVDIVPMADSGGKVDLRAMLAMLGERGINELHVEAGHKLNGSLLRDRCVDELLIYLAPSFLGVEAKSMFDLISPKSLADRMQFSFHCVEQLGDDLRLLARFAKP